MLIPGLVYGGESTGLNVLIGISDVSIYEDWLFIFVVGVTLQFYLNYLNANFWLHRYRPLVSGDSVPILPIHRLNLEKLCLSMNTNQK